MSQGALYRHYRSKDALAAELFAAAYLRTGAERVIPKGGAPRPAGLFQSDGTRAVHILNGPIDVATLGVVASSAERLIGEERK